jgi:hypothetical protein
MITIQELHAYQKLSSIKAAPAFKCPYDQTHLDMIPWFLESEEAVFKCLACNTILHLGNNSIKNIKFLIRRFGSSV